MNLQLAEIERSNSIKDRYAKDELAPILGKIVLPEFGNYTLAQAVGYSGVLRIVDKIRADGGVQR